MLGSLTTVVVVVLGVVLMSQSQAASGSVVYHEFEQYVDHFDNTNRNTFAQRYTVNDTHYSPGGPIFFFLSGEAPMQFFEVRTPPLPLQPSPTNPHSLTPLPIQTVPRGAGSKLGC